MNLINEFQKLLGCNTISQLPRIFQLFPQHCANVLISLTFREFPVSDWIDLFYYLQISFKEEEITNISDIIGVLKFYIDK